MTLLPMSKLGAHEIVPGKVRFGLSLPGIGPSQGKLLVKIIHERDQFLQNVQPCAFDLAYAPDPDLDDYWSTDVTIAKAGAPAGSHWGEPGVYVYRYAFQPVGGATIDDLSDPFGRQFAIGMLSAITLGYVPFNWDVDNVEKTWQVPALQDLVVYEIHMKEFAGSLAGAIDRLDYLRDLGVNCIEIMPVQNIRETADWGYTTTGYFGVEADYGTRADFQNFVHECHRRKIACLMDVVYGHVGWTFLYARLYRELGLTDPFTGPYAKDMFVPSVDFNKPFAQNFFYTANQFWLDQFHVDGFRYDCTPDFWTGDPFCKGYASLAYSTYQLVKVSLAQPYWSRFAGDAGRINLIQAPEELERSTDILCKTYSNTTWQDITLSAAKDLAEGKAGAICAFGHALGAAGFTAVETTGDDTIDKTPLQYIENHDHSRFLCRIHTIPPENCQTAVNEPGYDLLQEGDRSLWYEEQPYLIGLLMAKGIPFLWQGQEFGENYFVPEKGYGRIKYFRPVRWEYFYSDEGRQLIRLVRRLLDIRKNGPQFRRGDHYFFDCDYYLSRSLLLFTRSDANRFSLVALNFGDGDQDVTFRFDRSGDYREEIFKGTPLLGVVAGNDQPISIPSHCGRIWTTGS